MKYVSFVTCKCFDACSYKFFYHSVRKDNTLNIIQTGYFNSETLHYIFFHIFWVSSSSKASVTCVCGISCNLTKVNETSPLQRCGGRDYSSDPTVNKLSIILSDFRAFVEAAVILTVMVIPV